MLIKVAKKTDKSVDENEREWKLHIVHVLKQVYCWYGFMMTDV